MLTVFLLIKNQELDLNVESMAGKYEVIGTHVGNIGEGRCRETFATI